MSDKTKVTKFLIISDDGYQDKTKIKKFLFKLKGRFGVEKIKIGTYGDKLGVDTYIEDACFEFGIDYGTFPPYHSDYTIDCVMPSYRFGKTYDARYYYWRENDALKWATIVIILCKPNGLIKFVKIIKALKSEGKKFKVFYDKWR